MDWAFTDEQEQLAALTRQILERTLLEEHMRAIERTDDRFDDKLFVQLGEAGAIGVALPAELGGGGYGLIEQCRVLQEIGRMVAPVPVLPTVVAAGAIAAFGTDAQKQAYVPPAAQGRTALTPAVTEELNLEPSSPTTKAEPVERGWELGGQKTTVPAGTIADVFLVPASTVDGVGVFIVERGDAGVSVARQRVTDTGAEAILELDGVVVDEGRFLGGAEVVEWLVRHLTVGLCAVQLGVCERALELTAEYSKTRVQFDRPIATFQAVGQRLADAYIDVNAIRLTLWQAAWRLSEGLDCDNEIATAKFWAADAGHRVAHTAVHVHGGMGIDLDYHLNRYFVAAKRIEFALGGATEQLVALGRELANEPA
jgi:3-oxocholest-4-en-26-oyl-CoA dehydrogenase beta subunit